MRRHAGCLIAGATKVVLTLVFVALCAWVTEVPAAAQGWSNGYAFRRTITVDHTKVPNTDQLNFPVLVSGTYSDMATVSNGGTVTSANGFDIVFTSDASGATVLPFEQEVYNSSTGNFVYWVQIPTVSHTTDTVFYLFYGNSSINTDHSNKTGVWDSSYKGVWHLPNGSSLTANDSTSNGNNGTITGATATSGAVDGAANLNGSGQYIDVGNQPSLQITGSALTIETWLKTSEANPSQWERIVAKETSGNVDPYTTYSFARYSGTNRVNFGIATGGAGTAVAVESTSSLSMGAWTHLVGTYDGSQLRIYFNGNLDGQSSESGHIASTNQHVVFGGDTAAGAEYFNGSMDEVRISTSVRSGDWIATEYNNQSSPNTFSSVGSAASGPNSLMVASVSPNPASYGDFVTIQGSGFGAIQGSSTVSLNGSLLSPQSWGDTVIGVNVPFGATSASLSVIVNGVTAVSPVLNIRALPSGWLDLDVSSVGVTGTASYANGTFTVKGAGAQVWGNADAFHFAYQPLVGDGTVIARIVSLQGGSAPSAGVMIRESLTSGSANAYLADGQYNDIYFDERTTTGGTTASQSSPSVTLPYWVKLVRSGTTVTGYSSSEGVNWTQIGTSQTISMAQSIYAGLVVNGGSTSILATATFDSVSITSATQGPVIASVSSSAGPIGAQILIAGSNFGASQRGSSVSLNGTPLTINSWSNTSILITIPVGATSGPMLVSLSPSMDDSNSVYFTVTSNPLPSGWFDQDIGIVGLIGSATYANGTFTLNGAGQNITTTADGFHFAYQPLSGDGSIVARVVSMSTSNAFTPVELMIRETLDPGAKDAFVTFYPNQVYLYERTTTNASTVSQTGSFVANGPPYWLKLVRSGNTFSGFLSPDGLNWIQAGASVTVSMAQNAYIGLAVCAGSTTATTTVAFDNVQIGSAVSPLPVITSVSATTGSIGSQIVISGSNFGASQSGSFVTLNSSVMTVSLWSNNSIIVTIPAGATSGHLFVTVAPTLDDSNFVNFTVTSNPLPSGWLDQDIGVAGIVGSASYANGVFTVAGAGQTVSSTPDRLHFAYLPLSGDGSITARLVGYSGSSPQAVLMIRESLDPGATDALVQFIPNILYIYDRPSTNGNPVSSTGGSFISSYPYWLKLTRVGNIFTGYISHDGINWVASAGGVTVSMAQNTYIGMAVAGSPTSLVSVNFDNVSVSSGGAPSPVISGLSATTGSVGSQIVVSGSSFGATQGSSLVTLNSVPMTINSWSDSSITITIPAAASSGPMVVALGPTMVVSNYVTFTVTSSPLPSGWLDQDIGSPGVTGSASYTSGVFTVSGGGAISGTADAFHFAYQTLSGDGTIVARLLSSSGYEPGIMIRETLLANSTNVFVTYFAPYASTYFYYRSSTGGSGSVANPVVTYSLPSPWLKLTRSGNFFAAFVSYDGVYWIPVANATITMAQTIYVGLADANSPNYLGAAAFDNVTITAGTPLPTPVVTGITPTSGTIGTSITVTGSSFGATQGGSSVRVNGAAATVTSWSDGQIVAAVTSSASTGPVTVVVNSTGSNKDYVFSFYNPVISSVAPPAAEVGGNITLSGSGFGATQGSSQVQFNGITASISSWSDTSVVATVPVNATTGPVKLTEAGFTSNGAQFTVIEPVSISGISPASGPIGTTVTITGAGFGPTQSNSVASFYGAPATITSWSDTSIVTVVPAGASTGPVSVEVAGITIWSSPFTLTSTLHVTDTLGNTSTYTSAIVGGNWYITDSTGSGCSSCTQRGTKHTTYDSQGNVLTQTDELGHTTTYTYDSNGNVVSISQPDGNGNTPTTFYTYNIFNEVLAVTDALGNVTTNTYDAHGNLLTVTSPKPNSSTAASVTQFAYNSLGELTQITDPLSHITTLTYTPVGLIATIKDAQNNVTTYAYDTHGNRTSVTDALSHQTTFAYDTGDRLTTITYPDTTTTTFTYDSRGRRTTVTDQNGKTTTYTYDDADRLTSVKDAANNTTTYAYDTENNLTSITDANGHSTAFTYDAFGRVTNTNFPSTLSETYAYDAIGNLTSKTDRKGQTIQYVYDALNRLTKKQYPNSTEVDYVYDLVGKIQSVNDPTGTYAFAYDNMGRLIGTTTSYSFLTARNFTTGYSYDAASNRTGFTDPENGSTAYVYDTLNRLQTLTPPSAFSGTGSFGFSYDALSRRTQMTRPNNVATNYAYDNLSRLQSVLHQLAGSTIDGATYTVDNAGNRTAKTDQRAGVTSNYAYDAIYELTSVTQAANTTESYTYDPVGNRLSSLGVSPYSNNVSNQLTSTPSTSYTYDNNGNTLTKVVGSNTTSYTWDFENRLSSVTLPGSGGTVSFKYDPFGRRIYKSSSAGTSIYAYDGDNLIEETSATGGVVARYSQTLNIDEPLAMLRSGCNQLLQC